MRTTTGVRVEDLGNKGLTTRERYVIPLWASALGAIALAGTKTGRRLICWAIRAWIITIPAALALLAYVEYDTTGVVVLALTAGIVLGIWWRVHPTSFAIQVIQRLRGWWRWKSHYARAWYSVMDGTDLLTTTKTRQVYVPRVVKVRSTKVVDRIELRLLHGQTPTQFTEAADGLRHAFAAHRCKVNVLAPGHIRLSFYRCDPLTDLVPVFEPVPAIDLDLTRVRVGLAEDGEPYWLRLAGTHVLGAGATGAGKGSILWSIILALAPAIHTGTVVVTGIDPKGGMELFPGRELFTHYADEDPGQMVAALEAAADRMVQRKNRLKAAGKRTFTPSITDPFEIVLIDEIAFLTAYLPDKKLVERAKAALSTLLSQGRGPGFCVIALLQDPRKEVLTIRNLFPTRIALRLAEESETEMVLSKNAVTQGAQCHLIPEDLPGIGFVTMEGIAEPVRVRFPYITDEDIAEMVRIWPAPANQPTVQSDTTVEPAATVEPDKARVIDLREARTPHADHPADQDHPAASGVGIPAPRDRWDAR